MNKGSEGAAQPNSSVDSSLPGPDAIGEPADNQLREDVPPTAGDSREDAARQIAAFMSIGGYDPRLARRLEESGYWDGA